MVTIGDDVVERIKRGNGKEEEREREREQKAEEGRVSKGRKRGTV